MINEKMWGNYQDRLNTHWMIARDDMHILRIDAIRILQRIKKYKLVNYVLDYANGLIRPKKGGKKYRYEDYQRFVKMMDRCRILCIKKIKEERRDEIHNCGKGYEV